MAQSSTNAFGGAFELAGQPNLNVQQVEKAIQDVVNRSQLLSFASVSSASMPNACTAYFAPSEDMTEIWILSEVTTTHSQNICARPATAINIFIPTQRWGDPIAGLQVEGRCVVETAFECGGKHLYLKRFPEAAPALQKGFTGDFAQSRFHCLLVEKITVVHMPIFGEEIYAVLQRTKS